MSSYKKQDCVRLIGLLNDSHDTPSPLLSHVGRVARVVSSFGRHSVRIKFFRDATVYLVDEVEIEKVKDSRAYIRENIALFTG